MSSSTPLGRFIWHELMTTDPAAARRFYPTFMGWGTSEWQDGRYTMWMNGDVPVGGVMELPEEVKAAQVPPHWLTYVSTPDCDATAAEAARLGGAIYKAPWDLPSVGRIAVLADPHGAVFCLYTPLQPDPTLDDPPAPGQYSWHELMTTDPAAAIQFYTTLLGWEPMGEFDMGRDGIYHLLGYGGSPRVGLMTKPAEVPVCHWLPYARVADADTAYTTAIAHGATQLVGPMEVPGGDRVALMIDPQGAVFAVHALKK